MARLSRVLYKLFGNTGPTDDFGEFGSQTAGSPVKTKDIALIQSLDAWEKGWKNAIIAANRAPFLEDMNSLHYVTSYMLAYLMQEGVPEWNANTEYHQYSIVKKPGSYELYSSKVNNNTGNALPVQTDDTNWQFLFPVRASTLIGTVSDGQIAGMSATKLIGLVLNAQIQSLSASKLTDQVVDSQIVSLAAAKITGLIQDAQIAAVAASKITGQVGDAQISGMAASKIIGSILDAQITSLAATKITGQLVGSQIADGTITDAKIAAMAAAKLSGGITVTAGGIVNAPNQSGCRVQGPSQGVTPATDFPVSFVAGSKTYDLQTEFSLASSQFVPAQTGRYLVNVNFYVVVSGAASTFGSYQHTGKSDGANILTFGTNFVLPAYSGGYTMQFSSSDVVQLTAGHAMTFRVYLMTFSGSPVFNLTPMVTITKVA